MRNYLDYWWHMIRYAFTGGCLYFSWLAFLVLLLALGVWAYIDHLIEGLEVTNMTNQVSWGIGIANFVYFVGVAASAVLLVYPAYVNRNQDFKEIVIIGELLAFTAITMCLLFIFSDIGRPERFWHLIPLFGGKLNLPDSMLAWDVIVFLVYLVLNMHIPGYLLYQKYQDKKPLWYLYIPFAFISIAFAISIHVVTAFLLAGLGTRYFWNTSLMAPRFLISAFAVGPALLFLTFDVLKQHTSFNIKDSVLEYIKNVMKVTLPINLFLLVCELFKEFYPNTLHAASARYLYFGLDGHNMLVYFIWPAIAMNVAATILVRIPKIRAKHNFFIAICLLTIVGIWVEKGMGLIFPGFTPTPLGEIVEYAPNVGEIFVSFGVVALGAILFTTMTKVAIAILDGDLRMKNDIK